MDPGEPIVPFDLSVFELPFGTTIVDVDYETSTPEVINLSGKLTFCRAAVDLLGYNIQIDSMDDDVYNGLGPYPQDWVFYHTGGGLSHGEHTTFLVVRVYPVLYYPSDDQLQFIRNITVNISYMEPVEPILEDRNVYDLLIITPSKFTKYLQPLVYHKNMCCVETKLVELEEVYDQMFWHGRDQQEKIKYFIKDAIENWGIIHVLLVGGINGQTFSWSLPVRYSHVVPPDEQEYAEQSFISDLYYADIYDGEGAFSSWDSNHDNMFAVWNEFYGDEMDLYPDVYLGRLPCRTVREVRIMVNKIINYEKDKCDENWFNNLLLVVGDSYNDTNHFNEGELIAEEAIQQMPDFTPVKVYASEQDINRKTVNNAMNQGYGFAYFCGHGNPKSWTTHFPPNGTEWTTGYTIRDMMFLKNREKLPIAVVGGCHNAQFDVTMSNILKGIREDGLHYFSSKAGSAGRFWYSEWIPNCWAW